MTSDQLYTRMSRIEFVALMAMMFATIAFSIDAMLPAMPLIGNELSPMEPHKAALVLTVFVVGMGLGTFVAGPLSDAWGRKPVVYAGLAVYSAGALAAWQAPTLEMMLAARLVQGLGASGPRVVSTAIIRDLYEGRGMARILSLTMMVFLIVPALAPALGATIMAFANWRAIFAAFLIFALILLVWFAVRVPETLPTDRRRPLRFDLMFQAVGEMLRHPTVRLSIIVQTLMLTILFAILTMVQPIFDISFGRADSFPYWFGAIALASGFASFLNAALVERFGMRTLITWALSTQIVLSSGLLLLLHFDPAHAFLFYLLWQFGVLFQAGFTVANLNAIAMEPMGHIAGMAASVIGSISTVIAAALASPLGILFDGTPRPLIMVVLVLVMLAFALMLRMRAAERGLAI